MPPWLILLLVLSLAIALAYQSVRRRYGRRVLLYWVLIFAATLGAELLLESVGWNSLRVGDLRLGPDLIAGLLTAAGLWSLNA